MWPTLFQCLVGEGSLRRISAIETQTVLREFEVAHHFVHLRTSDVGSEFLHSQNATSLGGVESLIEQRKVSDPSCDPRLGKLSLHVLVTLTHIP